MANLRSGDIIQFSYAGREFDIKADSNITYRLSGITIENQPTGNGGRHATGRKKLAGVDAVPISNNLENKDYEFLQEKADGVSYPLNMTMIDGTTYSGNLAIEGDLDANTGDGQIEVSFMGEKLEQI